MNRSRIETSVAALLVGVTALLSAGRASAMPQFARLTHMSCAGCHDAPTFPRLNDVGYRFRRAGFRMPEQIGQDPADFEIANYFAARIQARYTVSNTQDSTVSPATSTT